MSKFLQVHVRWHNGTGRVVATYRDDAAGRREADRTAWQFLCRPTVESVQVGMTDRIAQGKNSI